ncbi:MAG: aldehyde dehydrogenase family protein [Mariprofundaceae bacterium]|nr:aldehyde dehydrogenase family protein [Mariprofundaceae bacterium]
MSGIDYYPQMISHVITTKKDTLQVYSPYDAKCIAKVETANAAVVEQALQNAHKLFSDRTSWLSVVQRIEVFKRVLVLMKNQFECLAKQASAEGGKPLLDSRIEMSRCIDSMRLCMESLRTQHAEPPTMGINTASQHRAVIMKKEPIGVVVSVSAFNHPLNLIAHQVGPAIAAGCPVIVKPSGDTPLSCLSLVRLFHEAGLAKEWCQWIMPETKELSESLVTDERVGFFSFIGSARVGWSLRSKLAKGTRCSLEHGGVAPVIMAEDADLDLAIPQLLKGAFYHAGQVCVSVQRLFVHESIVDDVVSQLTDGAKKLVVGDPLSEQTEVGPLIRASELQRVESWVQEAVDAGAILKCGGHRISHQCYAPTVLYHPPIDAKVSKSEIFGPVVCIYPFKHVDDAIAQANALDVAFQASVYSQNLDRGFYISERLNASAVMLNDHTAFRVDWMPFAGLGQAGLGVGGIPHTMHDMQIDKMTVIFSRELS